MAQRAHDVGTTSKFSLEQRYDLISTINFDVFPTSCPAGGLYLVVYLSIVHLYSM